MTSCETREFQLPSLPALSRTVIDRSDLLRDDTAGLIELWPTARLIPVDSRGRAPLWREIGRVHLDFLSTKEVAATPPDSAVFLGFQDGVSYWATRVAEPVAQTASSNNGQIWLDLRSAGSLLSDADAGLLTAATSVLNWHDCAKYCAKCGAETVARRAGWVRTCTGCGREEYPRTDPAVICLVHDGADQVLLARQPNWAAHQYSVLAGFVEGGESLEACVVREIAEEVGVEVHSVRYLGSQPWPFPRSLMIAFAGIADPTVPLRPAPGEIEAAMWVSRDDIRAALIADDAVAGLVLPGKTSISRRMLEGWALS